MIGDGEGERASAWLVKVGCLPAKSIRYPGVRGFCARLARGSVFVCERGREVSKVFLRRMWGEVFFVLFFIL